MKRGKRTPNRSPPSVFPTVRIETRGASIRGGIANRATTGLGVLLSGLGVKSPWTSARCNIPRCRGFLLPVHTWPAVDWASHEDSEERSTEEPPLGLGDAGPAACLAVPGEATALPLLRRVSGHLGWGIHLQGKRPGWFVLKNENKNKTFPNDSVSNTNAQNDNDKMRVTSSGDEPENMAPTLTNHKNKKKNVERRWGKDL